jgi:hypothetical protein
MSSEGQHPESRRPSVFISYASEDRVASRALRDTLIAAGVEVWYDESKLGGGDAWDQKIRRQIRDCEYFMPVISASTERRSEGYFRREWRLAAERTLDMADDVLFLLPVVIDDTSDSGARVPDKFLTVQWLRVPGGQSTPELAALIQRLLRGEHHVPSAAPRPAPSARSRKSDSTATPPPVPAAPPPMPPFPHLASSGFGPLVKFIAEVCWWVLSTGWMLFNRSPRLVRIFLTIWVAGFLIARCSRDPEPETRKARQASPEEVRTAIKAAAEKFAGVPGVKVVGDAVAAAAGLKAIVVTPFAGGDESTPAGKYANAVFTASYGRLVTARPADSGLLEWPAQASLAEFAAAVRQAGATFGLRAVFRPEEDTLVVSLVRAADATEVWTKSYHVDAEEPTTVAAEIATNALGLLPAKP